MLSSPVFSLSAALTLLRAAGAPCDNIWEHPEPNDWHIYIRLPPGMKLGQADRAALTLHVSLPSLARSPNASFWIFESDALCKEGMIEVATQKTLWTWAETGETVLHNTLQMHAHALVATLQDAILHG